MSSLAFMKTSAEHKIIEVNETYCKITGYSKEELLGKSPSFISSGKHPKEFYQKMWKELNETGLWRGKIINKNKSGDLFTISALIKIIKDDKGDVSYYTEESTLL